MLAACGQEKASYLTVLVNFMVTTSMPFFEWCYMWKCDDANTSGTPDCVLPCANSSSVQGSLIELAIVQATSYCELWEIPLKPVYLDQLALCWPEKRKGK